jgi:hypothetical protein
MPARLTGAALAVLVLIFLILAIPAMRAGRGTASRPFRSPGR